MGAFYGCQNLLIMKQNSNKKNLEKAGVEQILYRTKNEKRFACSWTHFLILETSTKKCSDAWIMLDFNEETSMVGSEDAYIHIILK